MYSLLKNRRVPGEAKSETLYRFPDVTKSPVREVSILHEPTCHLTT